MQYFDLSQKAQTNFQDAASAIAEGILDLHHSIFFYLIIILTLVTYTVFRIISKNNQEWEYPKYTGFHLIPPYRKYPLIKNALIHGTMLEIIWTITPSFVLVFIAIPSFSLLYSIDEIVDPQITMKAIGHQWFGLMKHL